MVDGVVAAGVAVLKLGGPSVLPDPATVTDMANPYRMSAIQGHVIDVRRDEDCAYMDQVSLKYTNAPFPVRVPDRVCFVISVEKAAQRTLGLVHTRLTISGLAGALAGFGDDGGQQPGEVLCAGPACGQVGRDPRVPFGRRCRVGRH
jgi:hypothetical protein